MENFLKTLKEKRERWNRYSDEMKADKKKEWIKISCVVLTTSLAILGLWVSIRALGISNQSLNISEGVRNDNRRVEKLDLEPEIYFSATLKENKDANIPPHFVIGNIGPVEAVQVEIQFITHYYNGVSGTIGVSGMSSEEHWSIDELFPLDYSAHVVSKFFLDTNARLYEPIEHNIIEARILYRRNPDRKLFVKRAFYFISPEGIWVPENSSALKSDIYSKMKQELLETYGEIPKTHDILHDVDLSKENLK